MPQLVKKRRSGWAVLAAGALIASLLAVAATPVGADHPNNLNLRGGMAPGEAPWNPDNVARWPWTSACVGDALDDHMFTDVSDEHAFQEAINCLAYYGITAGTGDGSTYSPNDDVTRAQMAVFIARAATAAGVDLGSGSGGFTDIGGVWSEAQDAINQLAAKAMIPAGGAFRPDDAITRAEMATFLFGLLMEASEIVSLGDKADLNRLCAAVSETCEIRLGEGASAVPVNDWFPDARDSEPLEVDKHISAMWELGVTGGAEKLPAGPGDPDVLVNITTHAFIDHDTDPTTPVQRSPQATVVSPVPLTFDSDGQATFSVSGLPDQDPTTKGDKYDIDVSVQYFPPVSSRGPFPLPYNYDPQGTVNRGQMAAFITRALTHTTVRPSGVTAQYEPHDGNVIVSVRDDDFQPVANAIVDVFHIDTPGVDLAFRGDGSCDEPSRLEGKWECEIDNTDNITGGTGDAALSFDSSDGLDTENGSTVWAWTGDVDDELDVDDTEPYRLDIDPGAVSEPVRLISVSNSHGGAKAHRGSSVLFTLQLRDKYGRATTGHIIPDWVKFVAGGMADLVEKETPPPPASPLYLYREFDVVGGNAVTSGAFTGVFSTEDSLASGVSDVSVWVGPNPSYVAADARGAATRVAVTVVDQYGDPLPGREVRLSTTRDTPASEVPAGGSTVLIGNDAYLAVDRSGSYTFGYERTGLATAEHDPLTADVESWDHDGDPLTMPLTRTGDGTVRWASTATGMSGGLKQIVAVDKDTNTIFVATVSGTPPTVTMDTVEVIRYDSNDRFNITTKESEMDVGAAPIPAMTDVGSYAKFEQNLFNLSGFELSWDIVGPGSRDVNEYTLSIPYTNVDPDLDDIDPVIYWPGR